MNVAVVVASNRPEQVEALFKAWCTQTVPVHWYVVWDLDEAPQMGPPGGIVWHSYYRRDIEHKLGTAAWIIPTRTGAIRSFGFLMAYKAGNDIIVSLDDDVRPCGPDHLARLIAALDTPVNAEWVGHGPQKQRGIPFRLDKRPSVLHEGVWWNVPDLDAPTRLVEGIDPAYTVDARHGHHVVPKGQWLAFSAMHFAVRRDFVPALYQLLMGQDWGYHRFDDIWSGLFAKKIADYLGEPVTFGDPAVKHLQASDVLKNLEAEAPGIGEHERQWRHIAALPLEGNSVIAAYRSLARGLAGFGGEYWPKLAEAMELWCDQFRPLRDDEITYTDFPSFIPQAQTGTYGLRKQLAVRHAAYANREDI